MAESDFTPFSGRGTWTRENDPYADGYDRAAREFAWARAHGFVPTERQLVRAVSQAMRVYEVVQGGKVIAGRHPEWLRGRADALRDLLRQGAGSAPAVTPGESDD
jgi:hypothetical protein